MMLYEGLCIDGLSFGEGRGEARPVPMPTSPVWIEEAAVCLYLRSFVSMNKEVEIKHMQEELRQLYGQVQQQQQRIVELHNQLVQLGGENFKPAPKPVPASQWISENFIGLRIMHLIGIVVLVIGLSIGVKYAIDRDLISELMRILVAYAAGIILFVLSVRLKKKYTGFSAILLSGGLASLYFTTYAAFVYYAMMPFAMAFTIMVGFTIFTVYQSIVYNRKEIALLGLVGAYGIPFLISQNSERADLFFLYISVINIGVIFLSIKKTWKMVASIAQGITWLLFIFWAAFRLDAEGQWIGFVFGGFFFLLFEASALSERIFNEQKLTEADTYHHIANNLALYISALFIFGSSFLDADIALITFFLSLFAAMQALTFYFYWKESFANRMTAALSLILFIAFIAFNWKGLTITLLWLLTAVILFAWGVIKRSSIARIASIILMGITLFKLVTLDSISFSTVQKVISYIVLGILLLVVSYLYQRFRKQLFTEDKS